jgi:hypothetical protein
MFEPKATAPHLDSTKMRNNQPEQMSSAFPSNSDIARRGRHFAFVPLNETARAVGAAAWGAGVPAMDGRWERVA